MTLLCLPCTCIALFLGLWMFFNCSCKFRPILWIASDERASGVTLHVHTLNYDVPSPLTHTHTHTYAHSLSSICLGLRVRGEAEVILVVLQGQGVKVWISPPHHSHIPPHSHRPPHSHTTLITLTPPIHHHTPHPPLIQRRLDMVDLC